jgi:hypothetical protein
MFGRRYVPKWMGGWCLKKEWHQGKKRKNKVDAEEIDRVLCAFAVAPWWWFGHTRDLRVVVVFSCYRHSNVLKLEWSYLGRDAP